jgi:hypothetical protein
MLGHLQLGGAARSEAASRVTAALPRD